MREHQWARDRVDGLVGEPRSVVVADFDGDGIEDALVGHAVATNVAVSLLRQDPFGFWSHAGDFGLIASEHLAVTDLEGDGRLDAVGAGGNVMQPLPNRGDGTFEPRPDDLIVLSATVTALVAEQASDRPRLVVVAHTDSGTHGVTVYEARDGALHHRREFARSGSEAQVLALDDVNGDDRVDLLVGTVAGTVDIHHGIGNGTFEDQPATVLTMPGVAAPVTALATGDVATPTAPFLEAQGWTVDGHVDVLAAFDHSTGIVGWRGGGGGAFGSAERFHRESESLGHGRVVALGVDRTGTGEWFGVVRSAPGDDSAHPRLHFGYEGENGQAGSLRLEIACDAVDGAPIPGFGGLIGVALVCADGSVVTMAPMIKRLRVTPEHLAFDAQRVGTVSEPRILTFEYPDGMVTSLYGVLEGEDAGDFELRCSSGAPGTLCEPQAVEFAPRSRGVKRAVLRIEGGYYHAPGTRHTVALTGVAVGAVASAPARRSLGTVRVGSTGSTTVAVRNDGDVELRIDAVEFEGAASGWSADLGSCASAVAPEQTCEVTVRFAPSAMGASSAVLRIESDSVESAPTVALSAEGVAPVATVAPVAFGSVRVGTRAERTLRIANDGSAPLAVAQVSLVGDDAGRFSLAGVEGCVGAPIPPAAACEVTAGVEPTARGALAATVRVESDALDGPTTADLSATGVNGVLEAPATVDVGEIPAGSVADVDIELSNAGDAPLTIGQVEAGGPIALDVDDGCSGWTLGPRATCTLAVRVAPLVAGAVAGELTVPHDGEGGVQTIAITATSVLLPDPGDPGPGGGDGGPPGGGGPGGGGEPGPGGGGGQSGPGGAGGGTPPAAPPARPALARLAVRAPARVTVRRGRAAVLRVVARNVGGRAVRGVKLRMRLPRGVRLVGRATASSPRRPRVRGRNAVVRLGTLAPGRARAVRVRLRARSRVGRRALPLMVTATGRGLAPARTRVRVLAR